MRALNLYLARFHTAKPIDETTKPSRVNRRRKKRWKASTIADLIKNGLTDCFRAAILFVAGNKSAGIRTPLLGVTTPLFRVVFLCLSFRAASCRFISVMAGLFGQSLRLAAPSSGSSNPLSPVAQSFEPLIDGYSSLLGVTA